jgi:2-keto-4-pentenoate hydratase
MSRPSQFIAAGLVAVLLAEGPALAACPDTATVARFARTLLERQVPAPFAVTTPEEARCAQDRLVALLAQPWGDVEGFAITGDAAAPLRGALFHATLRERSGATMEARYGARPVIAPGLLLRIGRDIVDATAPASLLAHIEAAGPYLALLDLAATPEGGGRLQRIAGNLGCGSVSSARRGR